MESIRLNRSNPNSRSRSSGATAVFPHVAAANSLQLLLSEDPSLINLVVASSLPTSADHVAFGYAAELLNDKNKVVGLSPSTKERATLILQDVERKLVLVESLAVKLSRTKPEAVAGQFLILHGYNYLPLEIEDNTNRNDDETDSYEAKSFLTLTQLRGRADRLERQASVLDSVALRVETSFTRGYEKLQATCRRLENVLEASSTLKSLLRLTFESSKLLAYDVEDLRDLTRAASSTAVVEALLQDLPIGIQLVDKLNPLITEKGRQVRQAVANHLNFYQEGYSAVKQGDNTPAMSLSHLGSILQVYYSLGELPDAVWKSFEKAQSQIDQVTRRLLQTAGFVVKNNDAKKRRQVRSDASNSWASSTTLICLSIWDLHRVLCSKSDPISRQSFLSVVEEYPIPSTYIAFVQKKKSSTNSIWTLFWCKYCASLASLFKEAIEGLDSYDLDELAALYPLIRRACMELVSRLEETPIREELLGNATGSSSSTDSGLAVAGCLGGSLLADPFLNWTTNVGVYRENPQVKSNSTPVDSWTRSTDVTSSQRSPWLTTATAATSFCVASPVVLNSREWKMLHAIGLYPLQQAFLRSCQSRLYKPLQYMFPAEPAVTLDDGGSVISTAAGLALLPSKYDVQRFDETIRQELSLADPRKDGGGDLTMVEMIAECVCNMITTFCDRTKATISTTTVDCTFITGKWNLSVEVEHDRKVAAILYATGKYLKSAGDKTFLTPYQPAVSSQHEEASRICQAALEPALLEIEATVKDNILYPLCRSVNHRILGVLEKMHHGVYGADDSAPSFVQKSLSNALDRISQDFVARYPPEYGSMMVLNIAGFTMYAFCSNASLLRPIGEVGRLHIIQDLADLELALEQLILKNGVTVPLSQAIRKPYAELRAIRQMLFWDGLQNTSASPADVAKALLREAWMKDVRPSTVLHYLFAFAPTLLSSPHLIKRLTVADYVNNLVNCDGIVDDDGEDAAWIIIMRCFDLYQQRSSSVVVADGDTRMPQIIMLLGQELMRRRQSVMSLS